MFSVSLPHRDKLQPQSRVTLRDLQKSSTNSKPPNATTTSSGPGPALGPTSSLAIQSEQPDTLLLSNPTDPYDKISLVDVTVPLESIKPSKHKQWGCVWFSCHVLSVFLHLMFCFILIYYYFRQLITSDCIRQTQSPGFVHLCPWLSSIAAWCTGGDHLHAVLGPHPCHQHPLSGSCAKGGFLLSSVYTDDSEGTPKKKLTTYLSIKILLFVNITC